VSGDSRMKTGRLRKDRSRFWASVVITAPRTRDGTLAGFVKVTRDPTRMRGALGAARQRTVLTGAASIAIFGCLGRHVVNLLRRDGLRRNALTSCVPVRTGIDNLLDESDVTKRPTFHPGAACGRAAQISLLFTAPLAR
jgi:hypothetical protein